jgi:hypothetical protein
VVLAAMFAQARPCATWERVWSALRIRARLSRGRASSATPIWRMSTTADLAGGGALLAILAAAACVFRAPVRHRRILASRRPDLRKPHRVRIHSRSARCPATRAMLEPCAELFGPGLWGPAGPTSPRRRLWRSMNRRIDEKGIPDGYRPTMASQTPCAARATLYSDTRFSAASPRRRVRSRSLSKRCICCASALGSPHGKT